MAQINYRLLFYPEPAGDAADTGRSVSSALRHRAPAPPADPVPVDEVVVALKLVMPAAEVHRADGGEMVQVDGDEFQAAVQPRAVELVVRGGAGGAPAVNASQLMTITGALGRAGHTTSFDPQLDRVVDFPIDVQAVEASWMAAHRAKHGAFATRPGDDRTAASDAAVEAPPTELVGVPGRAGGDPQVTPGDPAQTAAHAAVGRPAKPGLLARLLGRG